MAADIEPIVDWNRVFALREVQAIGEGDVVATVIRIFREDAGARVSRAHQALACGDAKRLRLEAHSLKGTAGVFGAERLRVAAERLERRAESGELTALMPLVDAIGLAVSAVSAELATYQDDPTTEI